MKKEYLIRVVRMYFRSDEVGAFLENFNQTKEKIRSFEGCHHLEVWRDEHDEACFMSYSYWESEEALNNYRNSTLFKGIWAKTKPLFRDKPIAFSARKLLEVAPLSV